ncbi:MAG: extracellular solute-binding protein [Lachnospiraceae bacterium]|nr:extracellular solute-binding protein [Lachnospiraceae bacterium]
MDDIKKAARKKKIKNLIYAVIALILIVGVIIHKSNGKGEELATEEGISGSAYEETYLAYLTEHGYANELAEGSITVDLTSFDCTEDMTAQVTEAGTETGPEGSISFSFDVEEEGFYHLRLGYIPMDGTTSDIQRKLYLDGELCYDGMSQIVLKREYQDEVIRVKNENEIRPSSFEIYNEVSVWVEDDARRNGEPYVFYLTKGSHTITFESVKEPLALTELTFAAKESLPAYADVLSAWQSQYPVYASEYILGQAERVEGATTAITKSSASINIQKNYSDTNLVPYHPYHIVYNTIGGSSYAMSGDYIIWNMEVPQDGLYMITFKGRQNGSRGTASYRRLYVNGEVPFAEVNSISFPYSNDMQNYTISDENGEPYLFYLKAGSNEIKLEVVLGEIGKVLTQVEESVFNLNQMYLKTIQITGQTPSQYIDYEIEKKVIGFAECMQEESLRLSRACNEMIRITGEKGENTSSLEKMAIQAANLAEEPESVVEELNQLKNNIASLGTWIVSASQMPLEIDSVMLSGSAKGLPSAKDGVWASLWNGVVRFGASFVVKQSEVASDSANASGEVLTVWMASSGKEQAQILQNMIDETFVPNYDIPVKLQLIPVDVVLRAALAGNGPDVVVGLSQATLADFAMRNAVVDISKLEGFEAETKRYFESAIDTTRYQDGVYGLPEQQNFMMLFYREDILDSIGAEVPKTWDEVKALIPVLQKNNYDFYMPTTNLFPSVLYQYGGDLYLGEGLDYGIESGLATEEAMEAFKDFTDFFTCYKLLVSADFSNRFRTGEMPIGITNYTTYCQLEIFAPEIRGLWSFAELPGVTQADGTIDNTYVTDTVASVIMNNSDMKEEAWTFLKWWTGTDTQLKYANTLESVMGTAARYPAADKAVLAELPWSNKEVKQLLAQMESTKGIPAIPASYMTTRMIQYAFNNVVADSANPRETLYLNVKDINAEIVKKRTEFSLSVKTKAGKATQE